MLCCFVASCCVFLIVVFVLLGCAWFCCAVSSRDVLCFVVAVLCYPVLLCRVFLLCCAFLCCALFCCFVRFGLSVLCCVVLS